MDKIEGVPEGWRLVRITNTPKIGETVISSAGRLIRVSDPDEWDLACIVERIEPTYRPFANAAEFEPHRDRWVRLKVNSAISRVQTYMEDKAFIGDVYFYWEDGLKCLEFADGRPFGVEVA